MTARFEDDSELGRAIRQEVLEFIVLMLSPVAPCLSRPVADAQHQGRD
ncbi:MAG: hypothetical protein R3E95_13195 [Thiolinea sp.]